MKKLFIFLFGLMLSASVYAQSADVITEILNSPRVSLGQICYLSAASQGLVGDDATYEDAIKALYGCGQIPSKGYETAEVPMTNLAFIYAQMFKVKGGLMYRITRGSPRYAFKQFKKDGIIASSADPAQDVSGWEALDIYTKCAFKYGGLEVSSPFEDEPAEQEVVETEEIVIEQTIVEEQ